MVYIPICFAVHDNTFFSEGNNDAEMSEIQQMTLSFFLGNRTSFIGCKFELYERRSEMGKTSNLY